MPVLTKINTNSIADDAVTSAKYSAEDTTWIQNSTTQNISGTYSDNRLYTSDAYTLSGNATINSHLALSTVKSSGDVVLTAGGAYTITGTGVLSAGTLLTTKPSLSGMTGELGSVVTGTLGSGIKFPAGHVIQFASVVDTQNIQAYGASATTVGSAACTLTNCVGGNKILININNGVMSGMNQGGIFGVNITDGGVSSNYRVTAEEHGSDEKLPASCSWVHTVRTSGTITVKRIVIAANDGNYSKWEMAPTASFLGSAGTSGPSAGQWGIMEIQS